VRVALAHDYLVQGIRGGERVLAVLHDLWPEAPVYTLVHSPEAMGELCAGWDVRTSFLQRLPGGVRHYQKLFGLMPRAVESLPLGDYDLVLSSSSAWAKSVRTRPGAVHICYCHSPARFLWHWSDEYTATLRAGAFTRWAVRRLVPRLREWDRRTAQRPSHYVANSQTVRERIRRYWDREAEVIPPPVDTERFLPEDVDEDFYLVVSALVPYKQVDLAVEAFNALRRPLVVVGDGPMAGELRQQAGPTVRLVGKVPEEEMRRLYARCRAFVMPQEEDFGIAPVEAMSAGRPVIAYAAGGVLETVVDGATGLLFTQQTPASLAEAVGRFEQMTFDKTRCRERAREFDTGRFRERFGEYVNQRVRAIA
jgi:glycosyltransferase involved in cell wall biosynthesis